MNIASISYLQYSSLVGNVGSGGVVECSWYASDDHAIAGAIGLDGDTETFCFLVLKQRGTKWVLTKSRLRFERFADAESALFGVMQQSAGPQILVQERPARLRFGKRQSHS
jgi:hypothetical protein